MNNPRRPQLHRRIKFSASNHLFEQGIDLGTETKKNQLTKKMHDESEVDIYQIIQLKKPRYVQKT